MKKCISIYPNNSKGVYIYMYSKCKSVQVWPDLVLNNRWRCVWRWRLPAFVVSWLYSSSHCPTPRTALRSHLKMPKRVWPKNLPLNLPPLTPSKTKIWDFWVAAKDRDTGHVKTGIVLGFTREGHWIDWRMMGQVWKVWALYGWRWGLGTVWGWRFMRRWGSLLICGVEIIRWRENSIVKAGDMAMGIRRITESREAKETKVELKVIEICWIF